MGIVAVKLPFPGGGGIITEDIDMDFGADNSRSCAEDDDVKKQTKNVRKEVKTFREKRQKQKDILAMIMDIMPSLLIVDEIDNETGESIDASQPVKPSPQARTRL